MIRESRLVGLAIAIGLALTSAAQDGLKDAGFNVPGSTNSNATVAALQADGKILVGGQFTLFAGTPAGRIVRLNTDGAVDDTYQTGDGFDAPVEAIVVQADGKALVGGWFTSFDGTPVGGIARLLGNGQLDPSFTTGTGFNSLVFALGSLSDGSVIAGGQFSAFDGAPCPTLIRLNTNGTRHVGSMTGSGPDVWVYAIDVDEQDRILIAGNFTSVNGTARARLARLDASGNLDATFAPASFFGSGQARSVKHLVDGRVLAAGTFTGTPGIARFLSDGTLDGTFDPGTGFDVLGPFSLAVALDCKIYVGGWFNHYNGAPVGFAVRLLADGALDPAFQSGSGFNSVVDDVVLQPDNKALFVGAFGAYNGLPFTDKVARVMNCPLLPFHADSDGDGLGALEIGLYACAPPSGFVTNASDCDDANPAILGPLAWHLDSDGDGFGDPATLLSSCADQSGYVLNATDCDDDDPESYPGASCDDGLAGTVLDHYDANCICAGGAVDIAARIFLDGPYNGTDMNDGLRISGIIPITEPYTALGFHPAMPGGGEQTTAAVLATTGSNAIVDWVMMTLRAPGLPHAPQKIRMALLQRDGDIVDIDGTSAVRFPQPPGDYVLEVRHRNHLGVMTTATLAQVPTGTVITVDLTLPGTGCYGTNARKQIGGVMLLWSGNTLNNGFLSYTGSANDRDPVLIKVGSTTPNNVVNGYFREDLNLDGAVKYTGTGNDRDRILINVGSTSPNNTRFEQLP